MTAPKKGKRQRTYSQEALERMAARLEARRSERFEELDHLLYFDNNVEEIARRVGFNSAETAMRWCIRNGRPDLAQRMHPYAGKKDVYHPFYGQPAEFGANQQAAS